MLTAEQIVTVVMAVGCASVGLGLLVVLARWLLFAVDPTGLVGCVLGPVMFVLFKGAVWLLGFGFLLVLVGAVLGTLTGVNWDHVMLGSG